MSLPEPVIPTSWPKFITAGTTFKVDRSFSRYGGAPNWSLSVLFAGPHTANFVSPAQITVDANVFHVVLAPADTQPLNPGGGASLAYTLVERLTGTNGEVWDVSVDKIMVSPNIASATAGDYLTPEEKILTQLQAALTARIAGGAVESYSIAGRSITKVSTHELREMIGSYKWIVYRQRNPGRIGIPGTFSFPGSTTSAPFPHARFWRGD